jgi:hypothetical protein
LRAIFVVCVTSWVSLYAKTALPLLLLSCLLVIGSAPLCLLGIIASCPCAQLLLLWSQPWSQQVLLLLLGYILLLLISVSLLGLLLQFPLPAPLLQVLLFSNT